MKFSQLTLIVLITFFLTVSTKNLEDISADLGEDGGSTFSNLFGMFKGAQEKEPIPMKGVGKQLEKLDLARNIFNGAKNAARAEKMLNGGGLGKDSNAADMMDPLKDLPLDLVLPRVRKARPGEKKGTNPRTKHSSKDKKKNTYDLLNKILNEIRNDEAGEKVQWQNPAFTNNKKKGGSLLPTYKIFGQKNKGKSKHPQVERKKIEQMIQKKIPFLKNGHIVNLVSTSYRNGLMLKIEYLNNDIQMEDEKMYDITARYIPKKHHLEIISLKENSSPLQRSFGDEKGFKMEKAKPEKTKSVKDEAKNINQNASPLELSNKKQQIQSKPEQKHESNTPKTEQPKSKPQQPKQKPKESQPIENKKQDGVEKKEPVIFSSDPKIPIVNSESKVPEVKNVEVVKNEKELQKTSQVKDAIPPVEQKKEEKDVEAEKKESNLTVDKKM